MESRLYKSVESVNSRTDGKGVPFAVKIVGENTTIYATDRHQGTGSYNGKTWNQLLFSIVFEDFNQYGMSLKCKDTDLNKTLFVQYGQDLYEQDSKEEFYKVCLILAKINLESSIRSIDKCYQNYLKGEYSYPINKTNVNMYSNSLELEKKIVATIDTTTSDLKFIKPYLTTITA